MWPWNKKNKKNENEIQEMRVIEASLKDIEKAVKQFSEESPDGVQLNILVNDDNTIDYKLLYPYLHGIPSKPFYMSKETYEIFEEDNKDIPLYTDIIQKAVDEYVNIKGQLPLIDGDPYRKVSYIKLENVGLIKNRPTIDFYITDQEYMITHLKNN